MCYSEALCTIESTAVDCSVKLIITTKISSQYFENVPLLVNFAKWSSNEN